MIVVVFLFVQRVSRICRNTTQVRKGAEYRLEPLPSPFAFPLRFRDLCVSSFHFLHVQANSIVQSLTSSSYFAGKGNQGQGGANYLI